VKIKVSKFQSFKGYRAQIRSSLKLQDYNNTSFWMNNCYFRYPILVYLSKMVVIHVKRNYREIYAIFILAYLILKMHSIRSVYISRGSYVYTLSDMPVAIKK
jgi:hypothetical protein